LLELLGLCLFKITEVFLIQHLEVPHFLHANAALVGGLLQLSLFGRPAPVMHSDDALIDELCISLRRRS
jgi:hypothetical protein